MGNEQSSQDSSSFTPSCSCQAFREQGKCKHIAPIFPSEAPEEAPYCAPAAASSASEVQEQSKPPVVVNKDRIAFYRDEDKSLPEHGRTPGRCGVFLDVDGVLHPVFSPGNEFCKIDQLVKIVGATGCDIVLSSSWRLDDEGLQEVNDVLRSAGIAEVVDITTSKINPIVAAASATGGRDAEIKDWLDRYHEKFNWQAWVAIDDLNLRGFWPWEGLGEDHAVVTDGETGLTDETVAEAIRKLTK
eukprot:gnl/MRDRNA2_/MRDRNA2_75869_c0_seq1.p1 gnl/MRDRNA2_/MRDRNA2_75869_c0~~gnl/MRDRNA2_/MRDRNA2_75869_c0_seq1.p1  ORF type:complete len:244 (-),score=51.60 gnl/MRDRNA2_/MRDRNA2_75869_c0_seq1:85-816(-)